MAAALSYVLFDCTDIDGAKAWAQKALSVDGPIEDPNTRLNAIWALVVVALHEGKVREALSLFHRSEAESFLLVDPCRRRRLWATTLRIRIDRALDQPTPDALVLDYLESFAALRQAGGIDYCALAMIDLLYDHRFTESAQTQLSNFRKSANRLGRQLPWYLLTVAGGRSAQPDQSIE